MIWTTPIYRFRIPKDDDSKSNELKQNPFPSEAVRVEGYNKEKVFRARVGDHRIIYYVNYDKSVI